MDQPGRDPTELRDLYNGMKESLRKLNEATSNESFKAEYLLYLRHIRAEYGKYSDCVVGRHESWRTVMVAVHDEITSIIKDVERKEITAEFLTDCNAKMHHLYTFFKDTFSCIRTRESRGGSRRKRRKSRRRKTKCFKL